MKIRLRFQVSLLILIVLTLIITSTAILFTALSVNEKISIQKAEQQFQEAGERIEQMLSQQLHEAMMLAELTASVPGWEDSFKRKSGIRRLSLFWAKQFSSHPDIYSFYAGFKDRGFVQVINAGGNPKILKAHRAPVKTQIIIRTIDPIANKSGTRKECFRFYGNTMNYLGKYIISNSKFDPTTRPWYRKARLKKGTAILTDLYMFDSLGAPGISAAHNISRGVVGLDMTLENLENFVGKLVVSDNSRIVLTDDNDRIIVSNKMMKSDWKVDLFLKNFTDFLKFDIDSISSIGTSEDSNFRRIDSIFFWQKNIVLKNAGSFKIRVFAPMDDFLGHLAVLKKKVFFITIILLLIIFPLVYIGSRSFSRFIIMLSAEADRIRRFDFSGEVPFKTSIIEYSRLSEAFQLMKKNLKEKTAALQLSNTKLNRIIELGSAMSVEPNTNKLTELILKGAKEIANADGGSLYIKSDDENLDFKVVLNDSLDLFEGGLSENSVSFPSVKLYDSSGKPNYNNVVTCAYHQEKTIVIDDAYDILDYDFSGTKEFDRLNDYRSESFLTVPLKVQGGNVIGALQLINARDSITGENVPFGKDVQEFVEVLSTEAATIYHTRSLIDGQADLIDSFVQLIAGAIDKKSPYTGKHCLRVPELSFMLADEAEKKSEGSLGDFSFLNSDERKAFQLGVWLHDCGKLTTPESIIDKSVRLEATYNRIHEIRTRFEVLYNQIRIDELEEILNGVSEDTASIKREKLQKELREDFEFVASCNLGGSFVSSEDVERLKRIGAQKWYRYLDPSIGLSWEEEERFVKSNRITSEAYENLIDDRVDLLIPQFEELKDRYEGYNFILPEKQFFNNYGELYNLSIQKGTLNDEERLIVNEHSMETILMLSKMPFPDYLKDVPKLAGSHHERVEGGGYPLGLEGEELSIPARIMAIADIFEALTSSDRPYKKAFTLSQAVGILHEFKKNGHIDAELFDLFLTTGIYRKYGEKYLHSKQLDDVDIESFLG